MKEHKKQTLLASLRDENLVEILKALTEAIFRTNARGKYCFGDYLMLSRCFIPRKDKRGKRGAIGENLSVGGL